MLMSSGFTDDLFPADETIRFYNRTRTQYPKDAQLALFFGDFGHPRAQGKDDVEDALVAAENAWMDFYVKGIGSQPAESVTAYTLTCPNTAPSGGPFTASNWAKMAKGEIRIESKPAQDDRADRRQLRGRRQVQPGRRRRRLRAPPTVRTSPGRRPIASTRRRRGGYTLMGAATVIAKFKLPGDTSQVAARLLDVAPDGTGDAGLARALAPGDRRSDQAGVPAVPAGLAVRRGPRAEARAAAEGLEHGPHRAATGARPTTSSR